MSHTRKQSSVTLHTGCSAGLSVPFATLAERFWLLRMEGFVLRSGVAPDWH